MRRCRGGGSGPAAGPPAGTAGRGTAGRGGGVQGTQGADRLHRTQAVGGLHGEHGQVLVVGQVQPRPRRAVGERHGPHQLPGQVAGPAGVADLDAVGVRAHARAGQQEDAGGEEQPEAHHRHLVGEAEDDTGVGAAQHRGDGGEDRHHRDGAGPGGPPHSPGADHQHGPARRAPVRGERSAARAAQEGPGRHGPARHGSARGHPAALPADADPAPPLPTTPLPTTAPRTRRSPGCRAMRGARSRSPARPRTPPLPCPPWSRANPSAPRPGRGCCRSARRCPPGCARRAPPASARPSRRRTRTRSAASRRAPPHRARPRRRGSGRAPGTPPAARSCRGPAPRSAARRRPSRPRPGPARGGRRRSRRATASPPPPGAGRSRRAPPVLDVRRRS